VRNSKQMLTRSLRQTPPMPGARVRWRLAKERFDKMVYELQPKLDWDKGRAVLYLIDALGLDRDDVIPLYLGDDITDEHAFEALAGRGVGIFVGSHDDPERVGRSTAADFVLDSVAEVERFLDGLAR
jgi:trehalose 6-phosphate phosphatase